MINGLRRWLGELIIPAYVFKRYQVALAEATADIERATNAIIDLNQDKAALGAECDALRSQYAALDAQFKRAPEEPWHMARFNAAKQISNERIAALENENARLRVMIEKAVGMCGDIIVKVG